MGKYRKKPVVVEAMQFLGFTGWREQPDIDYAIDFEDWLLAKQGERACKYVGDTLVIPTLEGDMTASKGDWIICGFNGELYPCKPDIFAATYEPV